MATILIVEDNDLNLKMARDLLQLAGHQTLEAEDADTGIRLAKTYKPHLILMDMYLPLMDGYEATRILKTDPEVSRIPVVAFTALAMEQEKQKAFAVGCSGFISKPIDVERFADTVTSYLNGLEAKSADGHMAVPSPQAIEPEANPDIEEFFLIASHDLQAPLRKIDQFTGMLKRSKSSQISAEDFELLERMECCTQHMHELVSDMLTLSRVNRKGGPFKYVDLATIVDEAIRDNQNVIDKLDARIEVGNLMHVEGDPVQLQQLFQSLIDNGLKYHRENTRPVIRISGRRAGHNYEIRVADNGIGIAEPHWEKIFRPFVRLHGSSSQYGGRGMGLAIAQKIVHRHQGTIRVQSVPGQGSEFIISLPA